MDRKRLYKTEGPDRMLMGVCGGLAEYFQLDPTLVRLGWILLSLFTLSAAFWGYLICGVVIPDRSQIGWGG